MAIQQLLILRKEELRRRADSLPNEVRKWRDDAIAANALDMRAHASQTAAIKVMIDTLAQQQTAALDALDPTQPATFTSGALDAVRLVIKGQKVWDFFRSKLELRFSPTYKDPLWVADTIAFDCHRPVLDLAVGAGLLSAQQLREPPLTYCTAEFSPATWVRGSRPNDGRAYALGEALLPIPVIEVPWDHMQNLWELCSLLHEVGHDIEADFKLRGPLQASLAARLSAQGVPQERVDRWLAWQAEVFADLVAVQLGGTGFVESLMHLLMLPKPQVIKLDEDDPHPTHYLRILLNCHFAKTLLPASDTLTGHADRIAADWTGLYGDAPALASYAGDFQIVGEALMRTPLLQGKSVADLMPFSNTHEQTIRRAAAYLRTGQNKPIKIAARHCVCAARIAATEAADDPANAGAGKLTEALSKINAGLVKLVHEGDDGSVRAANGGAHHQQFVAELTRRLPDDFDRAAEH